MTTRTWLALALLGLLACSSLVDAGKYENDKKAKKYKGGHKDYDNKKHDKDEVHHYKVYKKPHGYKKYEKVVVEVKKPKKLHYTPVKYSHKDWQKCEKYIPEKHYKKYDMEFKPEKKDFILDLIKSMKCEKQEYAPCCTYDGQEYYNECYAICFDVKYTVGACHMKPVEPKVEYVYKYKPYGSKYKDEKDDGYGHRYGYDKGHGGYDKGHGGYDKGHGGYDKGHGGYDKGHGGYDKGHGGYDKGHGGYDKESEKRGGLKY